MDRQLERTKQMKPETLTPTQDPRVTPKFDSYPAEIKPKMEYLKKLVLEIAKELELPALEETLK